MKLKEQWHAHVSIKVLWRTKSWEKRILFCLVQSMLVLSTESESKLKFKIKQTGYKVQRFNKGATNMTSRFKH